MAVTPQSPFYVPAETFVAAYKKRRQELSSLFATEQHQTVTEKLILSIYSTDVCILTFTDLSDIYKRVPDIIKRCHTEHMTGINVDLDHAERFEEENKKFASKLLDDTLIAVVSTLQTRLELAHTELAIYVTLANLQVFLMIYGMYNVFVSKDAKHLKTVLTIVVEYMIRITPAGPILSLLQAFRQYDEEIEKDRRDAETTSDFLTDLDNYIFEATRWCILSQLMANMWEYIEKGVEWDNEKLLEGAAKQVRERFARLLPTPP